MWCRELLQRAEREETEMTLECIVIPAWSIGIAGVVIFVIGLYLGYRCVTEFDSSVVVLGVASLCIPLGFSMAVGIACAYVMTYLPCITVIP